MTPAIEAIARLTFYANDAGGLRKPLQTPTPSLVFRTVVGDDLGPGMVGVIHTDDGGPLVADSEIVARVVFPEATAAPFVVPGANLALWNLRVVGTCEILSVQPTNP
jgi:hypothetical protein